MQVLYLSARLAQRALISRQIFRDHFDHWCDLRNKEKLIFFSIYYKDFIIYFKYIRYTWFYTEHGHKLRI